MLNCHSKPPLYNLYNFVSTNHNHNREHRSLSLKAERLKQIGEIHDLKSQLMKGVQLGKTSEHALHVIHIKLAKQRRQSIETDAKTEHYEERLPQLESVKHSQHHVIAHSKPPRQHTLENKENINTYGMPSIHNRRKVSKPIKLKSDPTIEFSPWENDDHKDYEFY